MKTQVLIIGGGVTGTGIARDLALRGVGCVLVEKRDINAGASGGNHGLLHSGSRYIASDPAAAVECRREGKILKEMVSHCIEETGGLFVAVEGDDENYIADFPLLCRKSGISVARIDVDAARHLETSLSDKLIAAYQVEDATIDPFMLSLDNLAHAQEMGAEFLKNTKVLGFSIKGGNIRSVRVVNTVSGKSGSIEADVVVNAAGAWAGRVAAMAGAKIHMVYSKGSLVVTQTRINNRVINRLRKATDADIVVPGGTVSILGTTSERVTSPDRIFPEIHEIDHIIEECTAMMPILDKTRYIRSYCGVRPLISSGKGGDDRNVSRGFSLIDHQREGVENFISITGGKLTTFRLMAEKASDRVCRRIGNCKPCMTAQVPLPSTTDAKWTEPGLAPRNWIANNDPSDILLCECEMVPKSAVDSIAGRIKKHGGKPTLEAVGLRSRIGKGPCQGSFCSLRVLAYLYDREYIDGGEGKKIIRQFLQERWRGQHSLLWGIPLVQAELQQALHCGLFGLELDQETNQS